LAENATVHDRFGRMPKQIRFLRQQHCAKNRLKENGTSAIAPTF